MILSFCQACPKYPKQQVAISLQYLKKDVSDEVDFIYADKHKGKFSMPLQYVKKKVGDEGDFWINLKVSCKLISTLWPSTFPRK